MHNLAFRRKYKEKTRICAKICKIEIYDERMENNNNKETKLDLFN